MINKHHRGAREGSVQRNCLDIGTNPRIEDLLGRSSYLLKGGVTFVTTFVTVISPVRE